MEDKENYQLNSDVTNKYKRKWNLGGSSRNNSQLGTMSLRSSGYQHSLVKNKYAESAAQNGLSSHHTTLCNIPELSFTRSDADVELHNNEEQKRQRSDRRLEEKKIFIVDRDRQTPVVHHESNLLCNEDLDLNLLSNEDRDAYQDRSQHFAGMVNPECIGIPSDISQFDK